jgi:hypothetical protein
MSRPSARTPILVGSPATTRAMSTPTAPHTTPTSAYDSAPRSNNDACVIATAKYLGREVKIGVGPEHDGVARRRLADDLLVRGPDILDDRARCARRVAAGAEVSEEPGDARLGLGQPHGVALVLVVRRPERHGLGPLDRRLVEHPEPEQAEAETAGPDDGPGRRGIAVSRPVHRHEKSAHYRVLPSGRPPQNLTIRSIAGVNWTLPVWSL